MITRYPILIIFLLLPNLILLGQTLPFSWSQSYCTYDIAQVLGLGEYTLGFGIDNYCIYCRNGDTLCYDERRFDIWARTPFLKRTELELKYSYPTAGLVSLKYQFPYNFINSAVKFGFGYMKGTRVGYITDYVYDFYLTLLLDRNILKNSKFYLAPRCIYSLHTRDRQEHSDRPPRHIFQVGYCLGLAFGGNFLIMPETNWLWANNEGTKYIVNQFGVGVNLKIR